MESPAQVVQWKRDRRYLELKLKPHYIIIFVQLPLSLSGCSARQRTVGLMSLIIPHVCCLCPHDMLRDLTTPATLPLTSLIQS